MHMCAHICACTQPAPSALWHPSHQAFAHLTLWHLLHIPGPHPLVSSPNQQCLGHPTVTPHPVQRSMPGCPVPVSASRSPFVRMPVIWVRACPAPVRPSLQIRSRSQAQGGAGEGEHNEVRTSVYKCGGMIPPGPVCSWSSTNQGPSQISVILVA